MIFFLSQSIIHYIISLYMQFQKLTEIMIQRLEY